MAESHIIFYKITSPAVFFALSKGAELTKNMSKKAAKLTKDHHSSDKRICWKNRPEGGKDISFFDSNFYNAFRKLGRK